jgi:hypothetical protein
MHENRETSVVSSIPGDRSGKVNSHKPDTHATEESHDAIVPVKPPNKGARASAEVVEGRGEPGDRRNVTQVYYVHAVPGAIRKRKK